MTCSPSNRRRLLARLTGYAADADNRAVEADLNRRAFERLHLLLMGNAITPGLASGMAAAITEGGVRRRRAMWTLGMIGAMAVEPAT